MFFSKKLENFKNIKHCFFSRKNGVSKGYYESLNCGLGSGDKKENVSKNLEFVSKKITCNKEFLITLNQKHSNKVIYFENKSDVKNIVCKDFYVECSVQGKIKYSFFPSPRLKFNNLLIKDFGDKSENLGKIEKVEIKIFL